MEQPCQCASVWSNTGEIRSFLVVTEVAGKDEVIRVVRSTMLPGDDVFNNEK